MKETEALARMASSNVESQMVKSEAVKSEAAVGFSADEEYFQTRKAYLEQREREKGLVVYPHTFGDTITAKEFIQKYGHLGNGVADDTQTVAVAGRVIAWREQSKKLIFFDLRNDGDVIQVMLNAKIYKGDFEDFSKTVHRYDIVGVRGYPLRTKTGELSIVPYEGIVLSHCLRMLPEQGKLTDQEIRYRMRHLDGIVNHDRIRPIFEQRAKIIKFIQNFFDSRGFMQVDTPIINSVAGGANADTFKTHVNATKADVVLRISPELYLKQLIVAGFERVYEIGKQFRNEGLDVTHSPEFLSLESYQAYVDYYYLMEMTEELLSSLVFHIKGTYKIRVVPFSGDDDVEREVDFTPPFKRVPMISTLEEKLGITIPRPYDSDECNAFLRKVCEDLNIDVTPPATTFRLLDTLAGELLEPEFINPTFLINHPQILSPLAKYHRDDRQLCERFELYINKKEISNAYSELNDPHQQRKCFEDQLKCKDAGDSESMSIDHTFIHALDCGLPNTGGFGLGISRLFMLLCNQNNIKEIDFFPMMKPLNQ